MNERDIFLLAVDIADPDARQAYLQTACADHPDLLAGVEALLKLNDCQSEFLEQPVVKQMGGEPLGENVPTMVFEGDSTAEAVSQSSNFDASTRTHRYDDDADREEIALGFLQPSSRPGILGQLAHYEVLEVLGKGAFGTVLKAFDEKLERIVAIKVLAMEMASTSPARKRFLREARASAAIRHENVINIYAVEDQPLPFLVMEYIPGETLQQRLDNTGPFPAEEVLRLGRQLAEGLAAAHDQDLIHRDIKPANILLEGAAHDRVKITDFGLARAADDASVTQSGLIAGTPMYMAPEQALGQKLDQRADLFSLGSVFYQMVSGRPPFRAASTLAVLKRVTEDTPRPITEIIPETPPWLCDIISRLHAKHPDDRFQTAREVADVLADCETRLKAGASLQGVSYLSSTNPAPSKKRNLFTASGTVALMLLLGVIIITLTNRVGTKTRIEVQEGANIRVDAGQGRQVEIAAQDQAAATIMPIPQASERAFATEDNWFRRVEQLTAIEQVEALKQELIRRNPGYDGRLEPRVEGGVVSGLKIITDHVTDIFPLRVLTHLRQLGLNGSAPRAGALVDISPLKGMALQELDLGDNPDMRDLSALRGMPLKKLLLYHPEVTDLTPLRGMPLNHLLMWGWKGTDLSPLRGMPLTWLNCGGGGPVEIDLTHLVGLPLDYLCLNHTSVSDLSPLKDVPLKHIEFLNTRVADPSPLKNILTLERINKNPAAEYWRDADRRAAEYVLSLGGVIHVNESSTPIRTSRDLPSAAIQLKYVSFYGNKIVTDADLKAFEDCTSLWSLDLTYAAVTNKGLPYIRSCPNLQVLNLAHTAVDDDGLAELKNFPKLRVVNLAYTRVTDHGLIHIPDFPQLAELLLHYTSVTDAGMGHLAACKRLKILILSGTAVTDEAFGHFTGLENLSRLDLKKTKVTAEGIQELSKSLPKCKIEWDGTAP